MTKKKILLIIALLTGMTGISGVQANSQAKISNFRTEANNIAEQIELSVNSDEKIKNYELFSTLLNNSLKNNIYLYLKKESSLTKLKKIFKKDIQVRKKVQKELVTLYNTTFEQKILDLMTKNSLQLQEVNKIKKVFF